MIYLDSHDCLRFDCIFHLKDLSGDSDDCLRGFCNLHIRHYIRVYYFYYDFCEYLGYGMLVYFGVYHPTGHSSRNRSGHLHIYSYFGPQLNGCYHNDHSVCHVCVYYFHGCIPVHHYINV